MTSPILSELLQRTTALRALARELVGEAHADDIVQEAAIQTITAPPRRAGAAGGWLAAVVRNLASKHRRAERIRHGHEAGAARPEIASPDRSAEDADILQRLTEVVTSLPEPYRGTILARYLREQTPGEIAAATATPLPTVKTRLQRGLGLLRQRLDERGGDWRGLLVATFALDPTVASNGPILAGTTMKLALLAAVLLPVGFAVTRTLPESADGPTESTSALRGSPMETAAPVPEAAVGAVHDSELDSTPQRQDGDAGAAAPELTGESGDPLARGASPTAGTPDHDLVAMNPQLGEGVEPAADVPLVRLDVVGPKAFRAEFSSTNLGRVFASTEGERLWRPLLAPVEQMWRQFDGGGDDFAATRQRVLDYTGRIRVLWMVQPGDEDQRDRMFGVFALEPDGSTDLTALAGDLSRTAQALMPGEPTQQDVGDHELQLLGDTSGEFLTIPAVLGGNLVAFFGEAGLLDQAVARGLRALAKDVEPPTAPVSLRLDLSQLKGLEEMRANPPLVKAFGLESLRSLQATIRPVGVHAQLEVEVLFGDGERGVVAAFLPAVDTLPRLLARIPPEATPWLALPFRPDVLYRTALVAAAEYSELDADSSPDLRQENYDELGLYVDTELLDQLGGEVMVLGDLWGADDSEVFRRGDDPPLGACLAMSLADTAAFGRGFDKLLDYLKGVLHEVDSREIDGVKITRMGSMFVTGMHMAVGQEMVALAFGQEGVSQLEALVAGGSREVARPLPTAVQNVQHLAPPGWNGVGLADLSALFGGQITLALEMLADSLPRQMGFEASPDETQEWLDRLLPLVTEYDLENLVTMTGHRDRHWRLRLLW